MSEELLQRGLDKNTPSSKIGKWDYYNIGATTLKALKGANIIRNVDYGDAENKRVDALIVNKKNVITIIEFKQPKEFKTKAQKQKAIAQEIEVARKLGAKIIIATDTIDTLWVNALTGEIIKDEDGNAILRQFNPSDETIAKLIEKINYSLNEKNNQILPIELVSPTDLARSIWQDIWSVSGATPENCLYTFVELFIFKYLSDLGILKNRYSFDYLMSLQTTDTNDEILQYYADEIRKKIKELFPYNPIDNTTIINGTIFVSKDQKSVSGYSTVFIKVLKKFQDYKRLEHIDYDFKSQLFESFLKESISKKNWGQFFTPMKVIRAIEKIAKDEIKEGAKICDPACGVGKFLLEPIKSRLDKFYSVEGDKVIPKITIRGFDKGFDKDEQKTIILAKANMLIYFSEIIKEYPNHTIEFGKIFNDSFNLKTNSILGTLRDPVIDEYDLILTNPPYVTSGSSNLKEEIQKDDELKKYYKINAIGVEGLFMEWIVRALKPNGKAFIVVPDGIFNRQNDKNLREFLRQECFIDGIISLPLNTFFTTNKKTYILCITKKHDKSEIQTDPVFTYLVSEIGESRDVYRFNIDQNDLDEATTLYGFFKGNKSNFESFNKDPRCKIFPIENFAPDTHWSVDRWWSREEKIELGIEEEDTSIKFEELPYFVEDIAENIMSFKNIILELNEKKKSDVEPKKFKFLLISEIFDVLSIPFKINKTSLHEQEGFPVYSSQFLDFGLVGSYSKKMFEANDESPLLTFGDHTKAIYIRKNDFSVLDNVKVLKPRFTNILLEYIIYLWSELMPNLGYARHWKEAKNISIAIPILPNGTFDLETQKNIIEKYNVITDLKAKAKEYQHRIKNLKIKIDHSLESQKFKEILIGEIFITKKGLSKYTRSYGQLHKGEYPVYSGSNVAPIIFIDTYDYDGEYLSWVVDGFAGYMSVLKGKFSATGHKGILLPKSTQIDINYVKFILEPILRELAKGRKGDNGSNEYTNVAPTVVENVTIPIPILSDGSFDLEIQQEIAQKYQKIDEIKATLQNEFAKIQKVSIDISM
ncbi:N-6 DNA methylase [uncultured Sulfuricurvum sp.]|uniref:N-6 DNA methylase n=1 Tax=uncultured Sulfuricurvum sp. TaxID=430693 RepID=UPI00261A3F71|nr:N-6 DNA methylase [uncultured Sulfuricurvum sp.]